MARPFILELSHVTFCQGSKILVHGISLRLEAGRLLAVLGPNGAGKSSLLRGILGLLPLAAGTVRIAGRRLETLSSETRAQCIAYVPQSSALNLDWAVADVVRMGRFAHRRVPGNSARNDQELVERAMVEADVAHMAYRSYLSLSGGERGRVLIARALATEAPLLLLDEPIHSLDASHGIDCLQHLRRMRDTGKTVVLVTHDFNPLPRLADAVLLMQAGQQRALGSPELLLQSRHIEALFGIRLVPWAAYGYERTTSPDLAGGA